MSSPGKKGISALFRKTIRIILRIILGFFIVSILTVVLFRWIDPPLTSFMLQNKIEALISGEFRKDVLQIWRSYDEISGYMPIAAVAAEDQLFPEHPGFDIDAIEKALKHNKRSKRIRGASTISQQVAKNVFLWSGRTIIRKGFEAYFTVLIELIWGKKRILEIYLNTAQMGEMVFGVEAASQLYFKKSSDKLTKNQAALLAAVLPNPVRYSVTKPSNYVRRRQAWILSQINSLGGPDYLKGL